MGALRLRTASVIGAVAVVAAACGGVAATHLAHHPASHVTRVPMTGSPTPTPASVTATVQMMSVPGVGPVVVDSTGHTLYLLSTDQQKTATCLASAQCAAAWPPLELGSGISTPVAGPGIEGPLLSTLMTPDGNLQVTYNHWPLYTFAGDTGPAEAKGEGIHGFGGVWSAVTSTGQAATGAPATSTVGTANPPTNQPAPPPAPQPVPTTTRPAPPTTQPVPPPTTQPVPPSTTQPPSPPTTTGIPQGNGGDQDGDNNGAPSDGDGDT